MYYKITLFSAVRKRYYLNATQNVVLCFVEHVKVLKPSELVTTFGRTATCCAKARLEATCSKLLKNDLSLYYKRKEHQIANSILFLLLSNIKRLVSRNVFERQALLLCIFVCRKLMHQNMH